MEKALTFRRLLHFMGLAWALSWTVTALAHSMLVSSSPSAGAEISAPEELELTFNEPVRLLRVTISDADGQPVEFGFSPNPEAAETLSYSLPPLAVGDYTVEWTLIGADGHRVSESFGFRVDPYAARPATEGNHDEHHGRGHG